MGLGEGLGVRLGADVPRSLGFITYVLPVARAIGNIQSGTCHT
jgi:hypothetical protein